MALKLAHFPVVRDLKGFDFTAQPSIDAKQICDLAAARWIANGDNLLLLGRPGVGKTHLAIALGRAAILAGYATLFVPATALLAQLAKGHADGRLEERLMLLAKPNVGAVLHVARGAVPDVARHGCATSYRTGHAKTRCGFMAWCSCSHEWSEGHSPPQ